jgi:hypothetical protein
MLALLVFGVLQDAAWAQTESGPTRFCQSITWNPGSCYCKDWPKVYAWATNFSSRWRSRVPHGHDDASAVYDSRANQVHRNPNVGAIVALASK